MNTTFGPSSLVARPASHTDIEMTQLGDQTSRLGKLVCELDTRLQRVLRSQPPDTETKTPVQEAIVDLAENIRASRQSIGRSCDVLESILNRLEV